MSKGYRIVESAQLEPLIVAEEYNDYVVAVYHWLKQELFIELKDQLDGVEIEVIKFQHPFGKYPALGVHYEPMGLGHSQIAKLIETTAERLLQERPITELTKFIGESKIDWKAVATRIMTEGI